MPLGLNGHYGFSSSQFPSFGEDGNVLRFYTFLESFTNNTTITNSFTDIYTGSTGVSGTSMKGIIQAGNGYVYVFPASGGQILKFDPMTEAPMERPAGLTNMFSTSQGVSIHLDDSGRYIYVFAVQENQGRGIVKIDTQNDTMTTISGSGSESRLFGVKAPNGNIYFSPYYRNTANAFTKFDTETETFSKFGIALTPNVFGWNNSNSAVVGLDEKIYCLMRDKIVVVDPMTDSITWDYDLGLGLSAYSNAQYYACSGVLAPNGCSYNPPRAEGAGITTSILKIDYNDPAGITYSFIPNTLPNRISRTRGIVGGDGNLYFTTKYTGLQTNVTKVDWKTDTMSQFGAGLVNACCDHLSDMTLAKNGSIYCSINSSYSTKAIKKINSNCSRNPPKSFVCSRYIKNSSNAN